MASIVDDILDDLYEEGAQDIEVIEESTEALFYRTTILAMRTMTLFAMSLMIAELTFMMSTKKTVLTFLRLGIKPS